MKVKYFYGKFFVYDDIVISEHLYYNKYGALPNGKAVRLSSVLEDWRLIQMIPMDRQMTRNRDT